VALREAPRRVEMRLRTISGSLVEYPSPVRQPPLCIEIVSAVPFAPIDVFVDELRALAVASLLLQMEVGRRVIKFLNLTPLLSSSVVGSTAQRTLNPTVNYLASLVQDPAYSPINLVEGAIREQSPRFHDRFGESPRLLERMTKFIDAIGMKDRGLHLQRPSIHVSLDQPGSPGARLGGADLRVVSLLPSLAHWWVTQGGSTSARLCGPDLNQFTPSSDNGNLTPLPYLRSEETLHPTDFLRGRILHVADRSAPVGFSIRLSEDHNRDEGYGTRLMGAALESVIALTDEAALEDSAQANSG
jgi:hypothetical protein